MYQFKVNDMMCNHCVMHITQSIKSFDHNAVVECSIAAKSVGVHSSFSADEITSAIRNAGYTPELQH